MLVVVGDVRFAVFAVLLRLFLRHHGSDDVQVLVHVDGRVLAVLSTRSRSCHF